MTVEQQVRAAATPGEALLILARAIDALGAATAADPWAIPPEPGNTPNPLPADPREEDDEATRAKAYAEAIAQLGPPPADPEDLQSWNARRTLAKDLLNPATLDINILETQLKVTTDDQGNITVDIPPPNKLQALHREKMVTMLKLGEEGWYKPEIPTCAEQYRKGGPLWLYMAYRDYMKSLPHHLIHEMILDVNEQSPGDAKNISQDLLKQEDSMDHAMAAAETFARSQ